ncbi:MAG: hypothetical protein ABI675_15100 [Chitinophagaceae bacterium]
MLKRRQRRVLDIAVTTAGAVHSKSVELDKTVAKILGYNFTSDKLDLLYNRGTQRLEINREEIYADNYETKHLISLATVAPNLRYFRIKGGLEPGNHIVKVEYKDNEHSQYPFIPYRVTLNLDLEINENI